MIYRCRFRCPVPLKSRERQKEREREREREREGGGDYVHQEGWTASSVEKILMSFFS